MKPGHQYIGTGVGAMIFNDKGELLMLQRGPKTRNERGRWQIPGGSVHFGETRARAIVREVREEMGVGIVVEHELLTIDHILPDEGQHWLTTTFVARIVEGQTPRIAEPHKHVALGWFPLDNLPTPLATTTEPGIQAYQAYLEQKNSVPK